MAKKSSRPTDGSLRRYRKIMENQQEVGYGNFFPNIPPRVAKVLRDLKSCNAHSIIGILIANMHHETGVTHNFSRKDYAEIIGIPQVSWNTAEDMLREKNVIQDVEEGVKRVRGWKSSIQLFLPDVKDYQESKDYIRDFENDYGKKYRIF